MLPPSLPTSTAARCGTLPPACLIAATLPAISCLSCSEVALPSSNCIGSSSADLLIGERRRAVPAKARILPELRSWGGLVNAKEGHGRHELRRCMTRPGIQWAGLEADQSGT